jgi:predicted Zn-dependent peptidase
MKNIIFVAGLVLALAGGVQAEEVKPETKKVCVDAQGKDGKPVIVPKTKKPKQECKEVRVHKKHEGTKPEDVKKK